jgi:hypothetical protein
MNKNRSRYQPAKPPWPRPHPPAPCNWFLFKRIVPLHNYEAKRPELAHPSRSQCKVEPGPGKFRRSQQATEIPGWKPCRRGVELRRPNRLSDAHPEQKRICGLQGPNASKEGAACRLIVMCSASTAGERLRTISMSRFGAARSPWSRRKSLWHNSFRFVQLANGVRRRANTRSANWAAKMRPYLLQAIRRV